MTASHQFFNTLFSILADLNNAGVWMVSTHPLISKSSSLFAYPFGIVPSAPIIINITNTYMPFCFFVVVF